MNVNGSHFELLLGRSDWGRCLDGDGDDAVRLDSWWHATVPPPHVPAWDEDRAELSVQPVLLALPQTSGETQLTLAARRAAAADRHGNVYWIGAGRDTLHVSAAGSRRDTTFWPPDPVACAAGRVPEHLDFVPLDGGAAAATERYLALAVTTDDYLAVAFADGSTRGFLTFDLVAGGPPTRTLWPRPLAFEPVDMSARCGGGVWVLDRTADTGSRVLWELDCRLAVVTTAQPVAAIEVAEPDDFQPTSGTPHTRPAPAFPGGVELLADGRSWVVDPISIETLGEHAVLLLDRAADGTRSRVVRLRRGPAGWRADASAWLDDLPDPAHDFVYARARFHAHGGAARQLLIATSSGNQARAFTVIDEGDAFALRPATELFPLRRFGGRALLSVRGTASYDSGTGAPLWTPVVHQQRARFAPGAELVTPVFDSRELGTTWDRVLLDACIPPGSAIDIESRAGDELLAATASPQGVAQVVAQWLPEPRCHLRSTGPELPWLRSEAARATRPGAGVGTWELLLQQARGRYLQLRVRLTSDSGLTTPRLRALRAWSPRFSYAQRFLPAVYREEPVSASLLERWLANFESTLTHIEDRIASVQTILDPRSAPADALAWLGEWLDVVLDPAWDEARRRVFIEHAMEFFRWRGTVHGLSLALELAFAECFDRASFARPERRTDAPQRVRIVEAHQTRVIGALAAGDPGADSGLREVVRTPHWTPDEGNTGLVDRYAEFTKKSATTAHYSTPFPLDDPDTGNRRAFFQSVLGFVPAIGADERARWQSFHVARYGTPGALAALHGVVYGSFSEVRLPRDWPTQPGYAEDWATFNTLADGGWVRARWHDFLARRYRRIERLNRAHRTSWPRFAVVAVPDMLPETAAARTDWLQFERLVLGLHRTAHRFSVLLPVADVASEPHELEARLGLARRIVELEKPAHTVFDVRFYWAFFRVDEARLGLDTLLGTGSRAPELIPAAVLGRAYMGASFVGGDDRPRDGDRLSITC
jgi:phage tail-like protein